MEKKEQGTVQALERGLKILELLMQEKRPMGVNEIAKCQGITPSAAYRIVKTLEANGWSFQLSDDKYIPGEKLSYITEKTNFHLALAEVAYPVMQALTARAAGGAARAVSGRDRLRVHDAEHHLHQARLSGGAGKRPAAAVCARLL